MTRRVRIAAIVTVVAAIVVVTVVLVLPVAVRMLLTRQLENITGRATSIRDVDLNLFTRRFVVHDLRVAGEPDAPVAELAQLDVRFRLWPLVRGRVVLDAVAAAEPVVLLRRTDDGRLNVEDIVERILARPRAEPLRFRVEDLTVNGGRIFFADRAPSPAVTWNVRSLDLTLHGVGSEGTDGRAEASFVVEGAPVRIALTGIGVRPLTAAFDARLDGFDTTRLRPYFPADAAVVLSRGRLALHATGRYGAREGLIASATARATGVALRRGDVESEVVTIPELTASADALTIADGVVHVDRLTLDVAPANVALRGEDTITVAPLRLVVTDGRPDTPSQLALTAGLPEGGTLEARGTAVFASPSFDLNIVVRNVDLALVRPFVPPDAVVGLRRGSLAGDLRARYADGGLTIDGDVRLADLLLTRRGQSEPFVRENAATATIAGLTVRDGSVAAGDITVRGTPTFVDVSRGSAQRFRFTRFAARVRDAAWPAATPARVSIEAAVDNGGTSSLRGTVHPGTLAAQLHAEFADVDLTRFTPYLRADALVALGGGRAMAQVDMTHTRDQGVAIDGTATVRDLVLLRRGEDNAFITDPSLDVTVTDLLIENGRVSAGRATIQGSPRVIERSGRAPATFDFTDLSIVILDAGWPGPATARIEATATLAGGGGSSLEGVVAIPSLGTDAVATFRDLPLVRANGYLPADAAVRIDAGRLDATVTMHHDRAAGATLSADGALTGVALVRRDDPEPFMTDERIAVTVHDLTIRNGAAAVTLVTAAGSPVVVDRWRRGGRVTLPSVEAVGENLSWPSDEPGRVTVHAALPESGTITAEGTVHAGSRAVAGTITLSDAAVAPFVDFLPISAPLRGIVDASLEVHASLADGATASVSGAMHARDLALGPPRRPSIRVARASAVGIDAGWPRRLTIDRVEIEQPSVLIERTPEGRFPLRAMLRPPGEDESAAQDSRVNTTDAPPTNAGGAPDRDTGFGIPFTIGTLVVQQGDIRFLDRTTQPTYSEELTGLHLRVTHLNTEPSPADIELAAVVGGRASVRLDGVVAPFARPFVLDVSGELTDFPVSRTNPYLQKFLEWIATRGEATTRVHYRIVGSELEATNEVVVERLDLEPTSSTPDRLVGLPLGLVVSLLKNARGEIRLTVPVSGDLGSPRWNFGDAIATALKNVVTRLVTGPFRLLGRVIRGGDQEGPVALQIDPVLFPPGAATLTPDAAQQVQRVADLLRNSPHVRIGLSAAVSEADVAALRQVADSAVRRQPPRTAEELASRRIENTRRALVRAAGVDPGRVVTVDNAPDAPIAGQGRVEISLLE